MGSARAAGGLTGILVLLTVGFWVAMKLDRSLDGGGGMAMAMGAGVSLLTGLCSFVLMILFRIVAWFRHSSNEAGHLGLSPSREASRDET